MKKLKFGITLVMIVALVTVVFCPLYVAADIIHPDDVIITQSLNVGNDSIPDRGFGFDTLILSENNLRIFFEDTSTSASFPTNDWRITVNDSTNGGANKFSIDDVTGGRTPFTIEAGASSNSLVVDSSGRIGVGTNSPAVELHTVDGDTPTLRFDQDGSSGWAPQVWDIAGNETNFFIRDVTNGSRLPFRIRPDAPTSSIDIASNGRVGAGTSSPTAPVHVFATDSTIGTGNSVLLLQKDGPLALQFDDTNVPGFWNFSTASAETEIRFSRSGTGQTEMVINDNGDLTIAGTLTAGNPGQTFPDYVFEPKYKLMPLTTLATYIKEEKHLPDIPTAEEIKKNGGVNISLLQLKMLKKIEELTLYTLAQQRVIDELKGRLSTLERTYKN